MHWLRLHQRLRLIEFVYSYSYPSYPFRFVQRAIDEELVMRCVEVGLGPCNRVASVHGSGDP